MCVALLMPLSMPCSASNGPFYYCLHIVKVLKSFVWLSIGESVSGVALHFPHITQILDAIPKGIHFLTLTLQ